MLRVKITKNLDGPACVNKNISEAFGEQQITKVVKKNTQTLMGNYPDGISIPDRFIEDLVDQDFNIRGLDPYDDNYEGPQGSAKEFVEELVRKVPPLRSNLIKKVITGSSYGKIFKLDNEHILKIFLGAVNPEDDMRWYRKCYEMLHGGSSKKTTLPVYGVDEIELPSFPGYQVYWVEMAEFIPLDKFLEKAGRAETDTTLSQLKAVFKDAYSKGHKTKKSVMDYIYKFIGVDKVQAAIDHLFYYLDLDKKTVTSGNKEDYVKFIYDFLDLDKAQYSDNLDRNIALIYKHLGLKRKKEVVHFDPEQSPFKPLTVQEVNGIIEAFCDMMEMGFKLSDVAPRNMAVLAEDDPTNPTIIIFDR